MDNLTEYALGGDPNTDDAADKLPGSELLEVTGTNWLEYVHNRRSDYLARGLDYEVQSTASLVTGAWTNDSTVVYVGAGPSIETGFDSVTNRLDTGPEDQYFLHLRIQEN